MNKDNFNYKKAKKYLDSRQKKYEKNNLELFKQATNDFNAIVKMLITDFQPKKIYQWGSLLNQEKFDENSDIDIAVEGMKSAEIFFDLYGRAMDLTNFPLDLIEIERIEKIHRESIIKNGKLIYEKK